MVRDRSSYVLSAIALIKREISCASPYVTKSDIAPMSCIFVMELYQAPLLEIDQPKKVWRFGHEGPPLLVTLGSMMLLAMIQPYSTYANINERRMENEGVMDTWLVCR